MTATETETIRAGDVAVGDVLVLTRAARRVVTRRETLSELGWDCVQA